MTCRVCNQNKSTDEFAIKSGKIRTTCKECHNEYQRKYYNNPVANAKQRDRVARYKQDNRARIMSAKYGLSEEDYIRGINRDCECCGLRKAQVVDHDHDSLEVRGFICSRCNLGIGLLGDTLDSLYDAVIYLER